MSGVDGVDDLSARLEGKLERRIDVELEALRDEVAALVDAFNSPATTRVAASTGSRPDVNVLATAAIASLPAETLERCGRVERTAQQLACVVLPLIDEMHRLAIEVDDAVNRVGPADDVASVACEELGLEGGHSVLLGLADRIGQVLDCGDERHVAMARDAAQVWEETHGPVALVQASEVDELRRSLRIVAAAANAAVEAHL